MSPDIIFLSFSRLTLLLANIRVSFTGLIEAWEKQQKGGVTFGSEGSRACRRWRKISRREERLRRVSPAADVELLSLIRPRWVILIWSLRFLITHACDCHRLRASAPITLDREHVRNKLRGPRAFTGSDEGLTAQMNWTRSCCLFRF